MESLWNLLILLELNAAIVAIAVAVTFASAFRALNHGKKVESNTRRSLSLSLSTRESIITVDRSQALMIPIMSSCVLVLMFFLFSFVSQIVIVYTIFASVSSLYFCLSPFIAYLKAQFRIADPVVSWWFSNSFTRLKGLLLLACSTTVVSWLVSGHWILNNLLGISICIHCVSHMRFPNMKTCTLLLVCLVVHDIFWVFFSERVFGSNVMVSIGTQVVSNRFHTFANSLSLPGSQLIIEKLQLPVVIVFPRSLLFGPPAAGNEGNFMMLGLGDMVMPGMLLALVLRFDYRKRRVTVSLLDLLNSKGHKYIWYALTGYAIGLVFAIAAAALTNSPQPALIYLVPLTLGPVVVVSWIRKDLAELWEGWESRARSQNIIDSMDPRLLVLLLRQHQMVFRQGATGLEDQTVLMRRRNMRDASIAGPSPFFQCIS